MAKFSATRGFTLLEMLAAICIVLILVATLYPALEQITPRAEKISCINNIERLSSNIRTAHSIYLIVE
jgi:prepilin-type N-terminal cleavage/methylation domain-containing protein